MRVRSTFFHEGKNMLKLIFVVNKVLFLKFYGFFWRGHFGGKAIALTEQRWMYFILT
jgi:hypothetical protein